MKTLSTSRSEDEDLVCIVENDACGVDTIQAVAGCSVGKGNLILRDLGKHAYTFIDRKRGRAIRIIQRPEPLIERIDPRASELRAKVMGGAVTPAERDEFYARQAEVIEKILAIEIGELFHIRDVPQDIPERAKIFKSVQCTRCGEMVAEDHVRMKDGKVVCIPCAGEYGRGW
ncbi:MAG: formylmethanofuran dehydrogenase subunit E [Methanoregula sp. SKADARSKE-2]|nr:MAG: formylmethanofuran dehydrogenase subunit E [Methanoregula sp. SKADARSKE-2]